MKLAEVKNQQFDVAIIGGGIIGAGVARDAALRGMKVALFEQKDFGGGTTAASTRLIHGGLRYLEQLDFELVKMDLKERAILLKIAPDLVQPLPFILPFYGENYLMRAKFKLGLSLYDWLAGRANLEKHRILKTEEIIALEPDLSPENLRGGALFYDAQVNYPERLCLANILDAETAGAKVFNYCRVEGAIWEKGKIGGVIAADQSGRFPIQAKITVNAAGAWFDRVAGVLQTGESPKIRLTKGAHLACSPTLSKHAVIFNSPLDGRTMFVIPWIGFTWIGTTDTDFEDDPETAQTANSDARYLIESAATIVPALKKTEIYFATAGVRALVRAGGRESSVSRKHRIETQANGLVSVLGGKITGYRAIAEEVTDILAEKLKIKAVCQTAMRKLPVAPELAFEEQILYAIEKEHCRTLNDFVFRRTSLGFSPDQARSQVVRIAAALGKALNWTEAQRNAELANYFMVVDSANTFRN